MWPNRQQQQAQDQDTKNKILIQQAIAEYLKTSSEVQLNTARAQNFKASADATPARVQNESMAEASQAADRELRGSLEAVKVGAGT